jgi:hypothetical protein
MFYLVLESLDPNSPGIKQRFRSNSFELESRFHGEHFTKLKTKGYVESGL